MDEVTTTARRRRIRTFAIASAALLGLAVAAPTGADAAPGGGAHGCFPVTFFNDDGPVTDLVHHSVEPLVEGLLPGTGLQVHNLNCQLSGLGGLGL